MFGQGSGVFKWSRWGGTVTLAMTQLSAQGPLDQGLLERHRGVLNRLGGQGALYEFGNQVLGNGRQRTLCSLGWSWFYVACMLLVIEPGEAPFVLGNQDRLEAAVTVARDIPFGST